MTVGSAFSSLLKRPGDLFVGRWNWKASLSSSLIRGGIFFFANFRSGWHAAVGAMVAEYSYRAITSGFCGALTQHFSEVDPEWQGAVCAMILLPLSSHSIEFVVHWLRQTPHLKTSIIASVSFTVISTLFNYYAMRRGAMTVGANSASMLADLRAMPRMIVSFVMAAPLWAFRSLRRLES